MISLGLKMCFDRILTEGLAAALDRLGIRGRNRDMLLLLRKDLRFRVQTGKHVSKEHLRKRGLRQGDPIAGILCITVLALVYSDSKEDVENHHDEEVREQNTSDPIKLKEALYANDAAIPGLASKLERVQAYINAIIANLRRGGSEDHRQSQVRREQSPRVSKISEIQKGGHPESPSQGEGSKRRRTSSIIKILGDVS